MAANPAALMSLLQGQTSSDQLPPLAQSLVAGQPTPPQPLPQAPPAPQQNQSVSYKIDPEVLDRPVRIRIDGSSRMLTKDILSQVVQFLAPFLSNGPFLQQLMQSGQTVDFPMFFQMLQEATGTKRQYPLIRPLNPQEEQRLSQPPPQVRAQMEAKQQEGQTRKEIMQMKVQADQAKAESAERVKMAQISEESARHIIEQILNSGGPEAKMMEAKIKAMEGQQKIKLGQQQLQQKQQEHMLEMQHKTRTHAMDLQMQQHQMGMDMRRAAMEHQTAQIGNQAKVQTILSTARAKQQAAKMAPKKQASLQEGKSNGKVSRPA